MAYLALTLGMPALKWAGGQLWDVLRGESKAREAKEAAIEAKLERLVGKLESHVTQGFDRVMSQLASQDGSIRVLNAKVEALEEWKRGHHDRMGAVASELVTVRAELGALRRRE